MVYSKRYVKQQLQLAVQPPNQPVPQPGYNQEPVNQINQMMMMRTMMENVIGKTRQAPRRHQTSREYQRSREPQDRLDTFRAQSNRDYEETRLEQKRLEYKEFGRDAPMAVSALPPTAQGRHRIQAPTLPPLEGMCLSLLIRCM